MRTTVYTNPSDPDETDEFPGCFGTVDEGTPRLSIIDYETSGVETIYDPHEWASFQTTKD